MQPAWAGHIVDRVMEHQVFNAIYITRYDQSCQLQGEGKSAMESSNTMPPLIVHDRTSTFT